MDLTPVVFAEGNDFFKDLTSKYTTHEKGLFIMTPSGAGKTYFCKHQEQLNWIDGDDLWIDAKAQPPVESAWWSKGVRIINRVEQRCDVITAEACDRGFWILGSVNFWYQPNAIVIPDWDVLVKRIQNRTDTGYDGGLTPAHHDQLKTHITLIREWHFRHNVPEFKTIEDAVSYLTN